MLAAAVFGGVLVLGPATALADSTSVGRAVDGVYPVETADIQMVEENVAIDLLTLPGSDYPGQYSRARCEFVFRNTSDETRRVLMGFPGEVPKEPRFYGDRAIYDFRAYAGGQEIPVALEPESRVVFAGAPRGFTSWYTFTVTFAPGQQLTVVNTYRVKNPESNMGHAWVEYVLTTGRFWGGTIGRATVTVNLGDVGPYQIMGLYPNNWRFGPDGRSVVWHQENFEPSHNPCLTFNFRQWSETFLAGLPPETRAKILARKSEIGAKGRARDESRSTTRTRTGTWSPALTIRLTEPPHG